ncbi:MAG: hypothetical protein MUC83_01815 [Pirellula sp.]|jgi:predicted Holliday junction resolvase-like endonuclease|nr:hypothetical protein [Pirellula sp.]
MDSRFWSWLVWGAVVFIAFRVLIRLAFELQSHLQELLVAYVREQKEIAARNLKIMQIREKVKKLKEAARMHAETEQAARDAAVKQQAEKVKSRIAADLANKKPDGEAAGQQRRAA